MTSTDAVPGGDSVPPQAPAAASLSEFDFAHTYETWMTLTRMNTFKEPGLEMAYRKYQVLSLIHI